MCEHQHLSQNFFKASRFSSQTFSAYSWFGSRYSHSTPRGHGHSYTVILPRANARAFARARCRVCVVLTHHKYIHIRYRPHTGLFLAYDNHHDDMMLDFFVICCILQSTIRAL